MKKKSIRLTALLLCIAMLAACGAGGKEEGKKDTEWTPVTVTDDLGREVTIDSEPKAVAAMMGSFADTWVLAGGSLKAAVHDAWEDFHLDLPEGTVDLGKYNAISLEQLFDAEVDLVIGSANTKKQVDLKDTLEAAGVKTLYFNVNSFDDYLRMLKVCTDITGREDLYQLRGDDLCMDRRSEKEGRAGRKPGSAGFCRQA